jgi:uncharacterized protein
VTPRRVAIAALLGVSGCAGYASYSPLIDEALVHEDYPAALEVVEKISRSNSELLYCYEKALVLRAQGEYAASNESLERAEILIEDLYTRSVTREVAALTVSESISQYRGDAFEAVRVNYYKILNYLALDDVAGALVECRRLNRKLQMLHDAGETYFVDDPFLQYLTALVYEMGGESESAGVSYRTAAARYAEPAAGGGAEAPPWLYCDAGANARRRADAAAAAEYDSLATCDGDGDATGRLTVVIEAGRVVRKLESNLVLPIFEKDNWSDQDAFAHELANRRGVVYDHPRKVKYWLRVSLPVLEPRPPGVAYAVVKAARTDGDHRGVVETRTARVEDLDAQAAQAFREKESTVLLRAIVRGLGKFLASEAAHDKDETLGALVNLIGAATETADTRSWTTLPEAILAARLDLPAGTYRLEADVVDGQGHTVNRVDFGEVDVREGTSHIETARAY